MINLEIASYISLIIVSIYILIKSADLIEDAFEFIAKSLKVSEFFLGFVILSAISSLPEMAIAVSSNNKVPELSIGNLIGATLILITLIVGISVIKYGDIEFKGKFNEREVITALLIILLAPLFLFDRSLSIVESIIMVSSYLIYIYHLNKVFKKQGIPEDHNPRVPARKIYKLLLQAMVGMGLLLISSSLIVDGVVLLGDKININESLIGLFVLAIGTNTPELTILLRAHNGIQRKLAMGNFIGSACINVAILGVLGILAQGVAIEHFPAVAPVLVLIVFAVFLFLLLSWSGRKITKVEAFGLVGVYVSLLISEIIGLAILN